MKLVLDMISKHCNTFNGGSNPWEMNIRSQETIKSKKTTLGGEGWYKAKKTLVFLFDEKVEILSLKYPQGLEITRLIIHPDSLD